MKFGLFQSVQLPEPGAQAQYYKERHRESQGTGLTRVVCHARDAPVQGLAPGCVAMVWRVSEAPAQANICILQGRNGAAGLTSGVYERILRRLVNSYTIMPLR